MEYVTNAFEIWQRFCEKVHLFLHEIIEEQKKELEQVRLRLRSAQSESQLVKNREQTAQRNVEKTKMLIQSTKRMIDGNQGVSTNSKSLLKEPNVMGLLLITSSLSLIPSQWHTPPSHSWPALLLLGLFGAGMQICMTASYKYVDAVVVGTMRYLQVPIAGLLGFIGFGEVPTLPHYIGAFLIVSSCIVIIWREFHLQRHR